MSTFRRALELGLLGALLGAGISTLIARGAIAWYWTPGDAMKNTQQIVNAADLVRGAMDSLVKAQLIGAGIGFLVFLVGGALLLRARAKGKTDASTPATAARV